MNYEEFKSEYLNLMKHLLEAERSIDSRMFTLSMEALAKAFPKWANQCNEEALEILSQGRYIAEEQG